MVKCMLHVRRIHGKKNVWYAEQERACRGEWIGGVSGLSWRHRCQNEFDSIRLDGAIGGRRRQRVERCAAVEQKEGESSKLSVVGRYVQHLRVSQTTDEENVKVAFFGPVCKPGG